MATTVQNEGGLAVIKMDYAQLGKHFDTRNGDALACKCCGKLIVNPDVIQHYKMLDEFRGWYNRPARSTSGCRCEEHNKEEGGAVSSQHLKGLANDIDLPPEFSRFSLKRKREFLLNIRKKWFEICAKYGVGGGSGFYNSFFHLDSRKANQQTWDFSQYF